MSRMLLVVATISTAICSLASSALAWQEAARAGAGAGSKYALLVGVERYEHRTLREPMLKYSVDDVTDLSRILTADGYETFLLTDDTGQSDPRLQPTKKNIEDIMRRLLRRCGSNDTVVLAFAGHGLQFNGGEDAYFCPMDARPFADEADTLVSISGIYKELQKSFAGVKLVLVDACRNDPDPGRGRGLDASTGPRPPSGVAALFSCSAGQRAFEHDNLRHGVFFHHVLEGLGGKAKEPSGEVTFEGLAFYVRRNVPQHVATLFPSRRQQPNMIADLAGVPPVLIGPASARSSTPSPTPMPTGSAYEGRSAGQTREDNGLQMRLVWCPAGSFQMGSQLSGSQVAVRLTKGYWIGATEVTQSQWSRIMGTSPWTSGFSHREGPKFPAIYMTHADATDFCSRLTSQERSAGRLPAGWEYRLPTEAQWEYACRAGSTSVFSFGDDALKLNEFAWFDVTTRDADERYAHEVGLKTANPWGIFDMHGNVAEFCRDIFTDSPRGGTDPETTSGGSDYVARGGSWLDDSFTCKSASRTNMSTSTRFNSLGFRVVATPVR